MRNACLASRRQSLPRRVAPALFLVAGIATCGAPAAWAASRPDGNAALLAGAEVFENITESAPTLDQAGFSRLYQGYRRSAAAIDAALTPARRRELLTNAAGVERHWKAGERHAMALDAVEAYRTLVTAVDRKAMPVPVEVSLLDYAGFRLNALLGDGKSANWPAIRRTTTEAHGFWKSIQSRVKDPVLVDAMVRTLKAFDTATTKRDPQLLAYAADMDLILVDGLETHLTPASGR
ncbi:MAG: hypothetical protein EPO46_06485 [Lysobacter sp.]|nr:MAG: hypothetical protein EPO46_06485 [Lysobacter sp.]